MRQIAIQINKESTRLGFWKDTDAYLKLMIAIGALADANSAYRDENYCDLEKFNNLYKGIETANDFWVQNYKHYIYNTYEESIVDCFMVLLDYMVEMELPFDEINERYEFRRLPQENKRFHDVSIPYRLLKITEKLVVYNLKEENENEDAYQFFRTTLGFLYNVISSRGFDIMKMIECKLAYNRFTKPGKRKY